ncbi:hypothetical protein [Streptomyces canus]|uniref:hypothetical protein n=1 Tax=Streptomyces canus TaxID=58343 RepID=UPI00224E022F|nr:hypothetical protein [Streptomyces canus]MCX4857267.1 hypothetical protein [Streptomyces canus]
MPDSPVLPAWLTEDDIPAYVEDFALHGEPAFIGAFNWYRNIELLAAFGGRGIDVPALYPVGWGTATWSPPCVARAGATRWAP